MRKRKNRRKKRRRQSGREEVKDEKTNNGRVKQFCWKRFMTKVDEASGRMEKKKKKNVIEKKRPRMILRENGK